jgi:hypothetical protein
MVFASPTRRTCTVLDRIGNKWAICVIGRLAQGPQRFSELQRSIDGITARMLTVTLRGLERDGILVRGIQATAPPRVDSTSARSRPPARTTTIDNEDSYASGGPGRLRMSLTSNFFPVVADSGESPEMRRNQRLAPASYLVPDVNVHRSGPLVPCGSFTGRR